MAHISHGKYLFHNGCTACTATNYGIYSFYVPPDLPINDHYNVPSKGNRRELIEAGQDLTEIPGALLRKKNHVYYRIHISCYASTMIYYSQPVLVTATISVAGLVLPGWDGFVRMVNGLVALETAWPLGPEPL